MCVKQAQDILSDSFRSRVERSDVIDVAHGVPRWIELSRENEDDQLLNMSMNQKRNMKFLSKFRQNISLLASMAVLLLC